MKSTCLNAMGMILLFLTNLHIQAQTPQKFNYQAVVRNSSGVVVPSGTSVTFRFTIRDLTANGTILYRETQSKTTNNNFGLLNFEVGAGTVVQGVYPTVIQWATGSKFFQVEMDPVGGSNFTDMGTTQLNATPYANFAAGAAVSENLSGKINPSQIASAGATTGQVLQFNGTEWIPASIPGPPIAGEGIIKSGDTLSTPWRISGSNLFFIRPGNAVGIGTVPSAALHVDSIIAMSSGGQANSIKVGKTGEMAFYPNNTLGTGTPSLWLEDAPVRVGIGTSSPQDKLDIVGGGVRIDNTTATPAEKTVYGNSMPFAFGYIAGTNIITDYGITSVTNPTVGNYVVTLDNSWTGSPVVMATSFNTSVNDEIVTYDFTSPNIINIHISDGTGTAISSNFSIVVFANP